MKAVLSSERKKLLNTKKKEKCLTTQVINRRNL